MKSRDVSNANESAFEPQRATARPQELPTETLHQRGGGAQNNRKTAPPPPSVVKHSGMETGERLI